MPQQNPGATTSIGTSNNDVLFGGPGRDQLYGEAGDDILLGGPGRDLLFGGAGNDLLHGNQGKDTLIGGAGDDTLDGGNGKDEAVFSDSSGHYSLIRLADGSILVKGLAGLALQDGTDRLVNIEGLRFADRTIDAASITQPCFAAGTRIRTARGEVPVEDLRAGELIATAAGGFAPAVWIGRRTVDLTRHRWPDRVRPIRVRAGALAAGVPARDLWLSPEHALALDGVLVPAGLLANGRSILQEHDAHRVTYFHVELPAHAVLFAEGAPAESYLDVGNRFMFEGGDGCPVPLDPHFGSVAPEPAWCAPRVEAGAVLARLRARLLARAEALGERGMATREPDLRVAVDGRELRGARDPDGIWRFALPAGAGEVRIRSRAACPAAATLGWDGDRRTLGVALASIRLRGDDGMAVVVPIDDPSLRQGFHPAECHGEARFRWTNGDALLPGRWLAPFRGSPATLELAVYGTLRYWVPLPAPALPQARAS
ncbi:MAG: Hint domain-containing protein [Microbispora sp.]|nr:Hint domain-containing protein [Microbispora sp.]